MTAGFEDECTAEDNAEDEHVDDKQPGDGVALASASYGPSGAGNSVNASSCQCCCTLEKHGLL